MPKTLAIWSPKAVADVSARCVNDIRVDIHPCEISGSEISRYGFTGGSLNEYRCALTLAYRNCYVVLVGERRKIITEA